MLPHLHAALGRKLIAVGVGYVVHAAPAAADRLRDRVYLGVKSLFPIYIVYEVIICRGQRYICGAALGILSARVDYLRERRGKLRRDGVALPCRHIADVQVRGTLYDYLAAYHLCIGDVQLRAAAHESFRRRLSCRKHKLFVDRKRLFTHGVYQHYLALLILGVQGNALVLGKRILYA